MLRLQTLLSSIVLVQSGNHRFCFVQHVILFVQESQWTFPAWQEQWETPQQHHHVRQPCVCNLYNIVICLVFVIFMIYPHKVPRAVASVLVCQMTSVPWCMTRGAVRAGCSTLQRKRSPSTGGTLLGGNTGINNCQSRTKIDKKKSLSTFWRMF